MAKQAGFLAHEKIDADIVSFGQAGGGSGSLMPQVARGKVQIGWGGPSWLINARQPGMDYVPLKFFYNYNRIYGWEITALEGRGLSKLTDLRGKDIGIPSATGASIPILRAILKEAGLLPDKDVKLQVVGVGAAADCATRDRRSGDGDLAAGQTRCSAASFRSRQPVHQRTVPAADG